MTDYSTDRPGAQTDDRSIRFERKSLMASVLVPIDTRKAFADWHTLR